MTDNLTSTANPIADHSRINASLINRIEQPILVWLASRMPAWVTPDLLTACGVFGSLTIFVSYVLTGISPVWLFVANLGFVVHWFGDSLDGTLARYRKIERPHYGYFIDHAIDAGSTMLVFLAIGLSPYVRFDLAMFACCGYLLLSIYVYLVTSVSGTFRLDFMHLGPTEVRLIAILANTFVFFLGNPGVRIPSIPVKLTAYDLVAVGFALLALLLFGLLSYKTAFALAQVDRSRRRKMRASRRVLRFNRGWLSPDADHG